MQCGSQVNYDALLSLLNSFLCLHSILPFHLFDFGCGFVLVDWSTCVSSSFVVSSCHFDRVGSNSSWQPGMWFMCLVYLISLSLAATSLFLLFNPHTFRCFWTISRCLGAMLCFSPVPSVHPPSLMGAFSHSGCKSVLHCIICVFHISFSSFLCPTIWWDLMGFWLYF